VTSPRVTPAADRSFAPAEGFVVTRFPVAADQDRSRESCRALFGADVLPERDPVILKAANGWFILNVGGGPDPDRTSAFLGIRAADIVAGYRDWSAWGAHLLTEPRHHGPEIRAYIRDPDGHLTGAGQTTDRGRVTQLGLE
jgi:lactoylglutathione lyase